METYDQLRLRIRRIVAARAESVVVRQTLPHSRTLATTYEVTISRRGRRDRVRVFSPYAYSGIIDRGRRAIRGPVMIWFNRRSDDPRERGAPYRRLRDRPSLTDAQYRRGLEENAKRREAGLPPYMIVRRASSAVAPANITRDSLIELRQEVEDIITLQHRAFFSGSTLRRSLTL